MVKSFSVLFLIILIVTACESTDSFYPNVIEEKGLEEVYDVAKWSLYCLNFENGIKYVYTSSQDSMHKDIDLLSCDVKLELLKEKEDTLTFFFNYYYQEQLVKRCCEDWRTPVHILRFINKQPDYIEAGNAYFDLKSWVQDKVDNFHDYLAREPNNVNRWIKSNFKARSYHNFRELYNDE